MYQINYTDFFKNKTQIEEKQLKIKKEQEENDEFLKLISDRCYIDKLIAIPKEKRTKDYNKNDCVLYDPYKNSYCYCLKYKTFIYITDEEYKNRNILFEVKDKRLLFKKNNDLLIGRNKEGKITKYKNYEEYIFFNKYEEKTFGEFNEDSSEIKVYENTKDYFKRKCKIFNSYDDVINNDYEICEDITKYYKEKFFHYVNKKYRNIYYKYKDVLTIKELKKLKETYNKYFENDKPKDIVENLSKSEKILDILNEEFLIPIIRFFVLYSEQDFKKKIEICIKSELENLDKKYKEHINKNPNYFDKKNYEKIIEILNLVKNLKKELENKEEITLKLISLTETILKNSINANDDQIKNILKYNSKSLIDLYINSNTLYNNCYTEFIPQYEKVNYINISIYIYRKILFYIKTCENKIKNFKNNIKDVIETLSNQNLNIFEKAQEFKEKAVPTITNLLNFILEFLNTDEMIKFNIKTNIGIKNSKYVINKKSIEYLKEKYSNLTKLILDEKKNTLEYINKIAEIFLNDIKGKEGKNENLKNLVLKEKENLLNNIKYITQIFSDNIKIEDKTLKTLILIEKENLTNSTNKIIKIFLNDLKNQEEKNKKLEEDLFSEKREELLNIMNNVNETFLGYIDECLKLKDNIEKSTNINEYSSDISIDNNDNNKNQSSDKINTIKSTPLKNKKNEIKEKYNIEKEKHDKILKNLLAYEKENLSKIVGKIIEIFIDNVNTENSYKLKTLIPEKITELLKNIDNIEKKDLLKNIVEIIEIFLNDMEIKNKNNNILKKLKAEGIIDILKNIDKITRENLSKNIDIIMEQFLENTKLENQKNIILKISILKKTIEIIKIIYNFTKELNATQHRFNENVLEIDSLKISLSIETKKLFNNINKIIKTFLDEKNFLENKLIKFDSLKTFISEKKENLLENINKITKIFLDNINNKNNTLKKFISIETENLFEKIYELEEKFQYSQNNKIKNDEDRLYYIYSLKSTVKNLYNFINIKDENDKSYFFENEKFMENCENFKNLFNLLFDETQYNESKKIKKPFYKSYNIDSSLIRDIHIRIKDIKDLINDFYKINLEDSSLEEKIIKQLNCLKYNIIENLKNTIINSLKLFVIDIFIDFLKNIDHNIKMNKFDLFTKIEIYNINYLISQIENEIKNKVNIVLKDILKTIKEIEKSNKIYKYKKIEYKKLFNKYIDELKEIYITIFSTDFNSHRNLIKILYFNDINFNEI